MDLSAQAEEYLQMWSRLHINRPTTLRKAPHKAVLLLSVIDLIEEGVIAIPFIPLCDLLQRRFDTNWNQYVKFKGRFDCSLHHPFYRLKSDGFWQLVPRPGEPERPSPPGSAKALKERYFGAEIPEPLFRILQDPGYRHVFRTLLIDTYLTPDPGLPGMQIAAEGLLGIAMLLVAGA